MCSLAPSLAFDVINLDLTCPLVERCRTCNEHLELFLTLLQPVSASARAAAMTNARRTPRWAPTAASPSRTRRSAPQATSVLSSAESSLPGRRDGPLPPNWADLDFDARAALLGERHRSIYGEDARPFQLAAAAHLLSGKDVIAIAPTGAGKSRIAQLIMSFSKDREYCFIVNPTDALGDDQVEAHERHGFTSFNLVEERHTPSNVNKIASGTQQFVLIVRAPGQNLGAPVIVAQSPETLRTKGFRSAALSSKAMGRPVLVVIDEAHLIYLWGVLVNERDAAWSKKGADAFRPDFRELWTILRLVDSPLLLMSATFPPHILRAVVKTLRRAVDSFQMVVADLWRPELTFIRTPRAGTATSAADAARFFLGREEPTTCPTSIFYYNTRPLTGIAIEVAHAAARAGQPTARSAIARRYHSVTATTDQAAVIKDLQSGALVQAHATCSLGQGIDNPRIRVAAQDGECGVADLAQRFGRAGRDGKAALAVLFAPRRSSGGRERAGASEPSLEDLGMRNILKTSVCLTLAFLTYFETGTVPLDDDDADLAITLAARNDRGYPLVADCKCSNCDSRRAEYLVASFPFMTAANLPTYLSAPLDELRATLQQSVDALSPDMRDELVRSGRLDVLREPTGEDGDATASVNDEVSARFDFKPSSRERRELTSGLRDALDALHQAYYGDVGDFIDPENVFGADAIKRLILDIRKGLCSTPEAFRSAFCSREPYPGASDALWPLVRDWRRTCMEAAASRAAAAKKKADKAARRPARSEAGKKAAATRKRRQAEERQELEDLARAGATVKDHAEAHARQTGGRPVKRRRLDGETPSQVLGDVTNRV